MYKQICLFNGSYEALFKQTGEKNGERVEGTQLFAGFCLYTGEFLKRIPHGKGTFFCADTIIEGEWTEGLFTEGIIKWRSGARYRGTMCTKNDLYFKKGNLYLECGAMLSASWEDNELIEAKLTVRDKTFDVMFIENEGSNFNSTKSLFTYKSDKISIQIQKLGCEVVEYWTSDLGLQMRALYKGVHLFYYENLDPQGNRLKNDLSMCIRVAETKNRTTRTMWFARGLKVEIALPEEKSTVTFPIFGDSFELSHATRFFSSQQPELSGFYIYKLDGIDYAIKTHSLDELFKHTVIITKTTFKDVLEGLLRTVDSLEEFMNSKRKTNAKPFDEFDGPESARCIIISSAPKKGVNTISSASKQVPKKERTISSVFAIFSRLKEKELVALFVGCKIKGRSEGFCEIFYENGSKYRGFFAHGLKQGLGILISSDGETLIGNYEGDLPTGTFKKILISGELETGIIENEKFIRTHSSKIGAATVEGIVGDKGTIEGLAIVHFIDGSKLKCRVANENILNQQEAVYYAADNAVHVGELKMRGKMGFFSNDDVLVSINLTQGVTAFLS